VQRLLYQQLNIKYAFNPNSVAVYFCMILGKIENVSLCNINRLAFGMEIVSTYRIFKCVFHGMFASKCLLNVLIPTTIPHTISNRKFDISHSCLISGFRREVDENCTLLRHYAASGGNLLPRFRDNLPYSRKNP